ncbi:MAG: three-Cys-motif partner protein TcmP [Janthinobacterium lividum]
MNPFGGNWTAEKIDVFMKYVSAYLQIMKNQSHFRLLYFDGFAGSGVINPDEDPDQFMQGVATQVLSITEPREFDLYMFVEKNPDRAANLQALVEQYFPDKGKRVRIAEGDCNEKLLLLAAYMRSPLHRNDRALAFIDPFGMQLSWDTLAALRGIEMDAWILVPTGIGIGRLLKNDGQIRPAWMARLQDFLGMNEEEIRGYFYREETTHTLFGAETNVVKQERAVERAGQLYRERIRAANIFSHVSEPLILKNSRNSVMYHFILCSNNAVALKIANDITRKINRR